MKLHEKKSKKTLNRNKLREMERKAAKQASEQFQSLYFFVFLKLERKENFVFSTKRKKLHFIKMSKTEIEEVGRKRERGETLSGEFP